MIETRPLKFKTPEDLQSRIDEYFNGGMNKKTMFTKEGIEYEVPIPTVSGLAIFLGFESRQSFYDYEKREQFSYTIKRARLFIEREYEELLQTANVTGAIFALKNMGWMDKQHTDITSGGEKINININTDLM
jgi:hypothetical protein